MRNIVLLAAALLSVGITPVQATQTAAKSATIRHTDLDLSSRAGRAKLNRRIASATEAVCGSYDGASEDRERAISRCRADARRQIAGQLANLRIGDRLATR